MPLSQFELAILFTLAYTDQFSYPLTETEIWRRLISLDTKSVKHTELAPAIQQLVNQKLIAETAGFFHLTGRRVIVKKRLQRSQISQKKVSEMALLQRIVRQIPWITAVFITGSVAMQNAEQDDDIDLFIITKKNRLWLSRLVLLFATWLIGKKKNRFDEGKHGWCFNLWLDENHLAVPPEKRDVYQAYEIFQAKPMEMVGVAAAAQQFYDQNQWLTKYLPHAKLDLKKPNVKKRIPVKKKIESTSHWIDLLESWVFYGQFQYMKAHRTTEQVGSGFAFFHPRPTDQLVCAGWLKSIRQLKNSAKHTAKLATIATTYAPKLFIQSV